MEKASGMVALWLEALRRVLDATLKLLDPGDEGKVQIHQAARGSRLSCVAERVRFAPMRTPEHHLARLGAFDPALDQGPCNGHTTAADAVWIDRPVLALHGTRFRSRAAQA